MDRSASAGTCCVTIRLIFPPPLIWRILKKHQVEPFYALLDKKDRQLDWQQALAGWESFYNKQRLHSSLHGKTPWEKYQEVQATVLTLAQIQHCYGQKKETIKARNSFFIQWQKKIIWLNWMSSAKCVIFHHWLFYSDPAQVRIKKSNFQEFTHALTEQND